MSVAGEKQGSVERLTPYELQELLRASWAIEDAPPVEVQEAIRRKLRAAVDRGPEPDQKDVDSLASARGFTDADVEAGARVLWHGRDSVGQGGGWGLYENVSEAVHGKLRKQARLVLGAVLRGPEPEAKADYLCPCPDCECEAGHQPEAGSIPRGEGESLTAYGRRVREGEQ